MPGMRPSVTVLEGGSRTASPLEAAYDHFRLVLQGDLVSDRTLDHYDDMVQPFLTWAADAGVRRFEDMPSVVVERYRAELAARATSSTKSTPPRSERFKQLLRPLVWQMTEAIVFIESPRLRRDGRETTSADPTLC